MHEALVKHGGEYNLNSVTRIANEINLDLDKFKSDLRSRNITRRLRDDIRLARKRKVAVAPAITINGYVYTGAWDEEALIEALDNSNTKSVEQAMKSFVNWGASAAVVLLVAALLALVFVNTGFFHEYEFLHNFRFGFSAGNHVFELPTEVWINDGLMAVFFLLIGLEIKREIISGELSDIKKASMPVVGAIGGMLIPALLYYGINYNGEGVGGWGVPMATDIAFTLGLMALLGSKGTYGRRLS